MSKADCRIETDSLGKVEVPSDALYGAQTQRAAENFPVSGLRLPRRVIRALALIKKAAAEVNRASGKLDANVADAIIKAAHEVATGGARADTGAHPRLSSRMRGSISAQARSARRLPTTTNTDVSRRPPSITG